jgi:hypothetical protein
MKKLFFYALISFIASNNIYSQKTNLSYNLKIPDSIYDKLEKFYLNEGENVNSHINVYNLSSKTVNFGNKSGVYTFNLTGAHFPRRLFIFSNNKVFIFKSKGAFDSLGVLQEFIDCVKLLEITESDRIKYLKIICKYLQEELGQTYGAEITPATSSNREIR